MEIVFSKEVVEYPIYIIINGEMHDLKEIIKEHGEAVFIGEQGMESLKRGEDNA